MPTFNGTTGNDTLTGTEDADILNGLAGDDQLDGLGGNDTLDGGTGADMMNGGAGNDFYLIDNADDRLLDSGGADELVTSVNYRLANDRSTVSEVAIEILRAAPGTAPISITGNNYGQDIYGNDGNNLLIGGGGHLFRIIPNEGNFVQMTGDWMYGGLGNDTYVVRPLDRIFDGQGGGDDVVLVSSGEYSLRFEEIETMVAADGTEPIILRGNGYSQSIYGNAGNNLIFGNGGLDYLVGGAGADTYFIDSHSIIQEDAGGDSDGVSTSISFTLPANVESLSGRGSADLTLRGNDLDNSISGNSGNNLMAGSAGNDLLVGNDGNDLLNGGAGADRMEGGVGNDLYIVDNLDDQIFEFPSGSSSGGDDTISTFISYSLRADAAIETLAAQESAGAVTLRGNSFGNSIYGNSSNNVLWGGGGVDYLAGGGGDDIYFLDDTSGRQTISESASGGHDIAFSAATYTLGAGVHVEVLSVFGQTGTDPLALFGNETANHIIGNDGANTLSGGLGRDAFSGRAGADLFVFAALGEDNADQIYDFAPGSDRIGLEDSVFVGFQPGSLSPDAFRVGTGAQDSSDRIIYDPATGRLWFDPDGNGAAQMIIFGYVGANTALSPTDFLIV